MKYEMIPEHQVSYSKLQAARKMQDFCMIDLRLKKRPKIEWFTRNISYRGAVFETQVEIGGDYTFKNDMIRILVDQSPEEIKRAIAHEMRHSYQHSKGDAIDPYCQAWEYDADAYAEDCLRVEPEFSMYRYFRTDATKKSWYTSPGRIRSTKPRLIETRMAVEGRKIKGYAAEFNSESLNLGGFTEILRPGCFAKSLMNRDNDICLLVNHDTGKPLARRSAGNLIIREDSIGLYFEAGPLPDTTLARDTLENLNSNILKNMSFGFLIREDNWIGTLREVLEADIREISIVLNPAYPDSSAYVG